MASLQYVIDSICSKVTVESIHRMIRLRLDRGRFGITEIIPQIQQEDRSLDHDSAKMIAEAAISEMAQSGDLRVDGQSVFPAK
jgi:hypothetical protein